MKTRRFPCPSLPARCAIAVLAGLFVVKPALADVGGKRYDDLFSMSLEQLLDSQVTGSTLTRKQLRTVPSSVTVFNRTQINNLGAEYLHELLNYVPGFQSYRQAEGSAEYFHSSRGHRTSVSSREVLILVDGMRMNRQFDNALAVPMLSLANVESVEFIRGPGSALYGSNAFLGVINITTSRHENRLQVSVGSFGRRQVGVAGSKEMVGFTVDLSGIFFEEDGQTLPLENFSTYEPESNKDPRSGYDVQLTLEKDNTRFQADFFKRKSQGFYVAENTSRDQNVSVHRHKHFVVKQRAPWTSSLESNVSLAYSKSSFVPETEIASLGRFQAEQEETNVDVGLLNTWKYSADWNFLFGFDYRHSDLPAFRARTENLGEIIFYPDQTQELSSVFLQTQKQFETGVELILGARYDQYNNIGSSANPRLGVVVPLTDSQVLKFLYGEAFRVPTMNELYLQTLGGLLQGNPKLDPETVKSWELIWIGQWSGLSTTVNTFYNVLDNTIVRGDTLSMSDFKNITSEESFYGVELEVAAQVNENWMVTFNTSKLESLPDADYRQADLLGSFAVNYYAGPWNANLSATYADERKMLAVDDRITLDAYWEVNSKIRYAFSETLELYLRARNLLDEDYLTPTDRSRHREPVSNRGRELSVGITCEF